MKMSDQLTIKMDVLADKILASASPDIVAYEKLEDLAFWADSNGIALSEKHLKALRKLPPDHRAGTATPTPKASA